MRDGDRDLVEACLAEGESTMVGLMRFRLSLAWRGLAMADGRLDDLGALVREADESYPRLGLQIVTGGNDRLETRMVGGDATTVAEARGGDAGAMADLLDTAVNSFEAALGVGVIEGDHLLAVLDRLDAVGVNEMLGPVVALQAELTARCGDARVAARVAARLLTILDRLGGRYLIQGGGFRICSRHAPGATRRARRRRPRRRRVAGRGRHRRPNRPRRARRRVRRRACRLANVSLPTGPG